MAAAFAAALGREVKTETIPERDWIDTFKSVGFSERAAISYANMTRAVCEDDSPAVTGTLHGTTTLEQYIREQLSRSG